MSKAELAAQAWEACAKIVGETDMDDYPEYGNDLLEAIDAACDEMGEQASRLRAEEEIISEVHSNLLTPPSIKERR